MAVEVQMQQMLAQMQSMGQVVSQLQNEIEKLKAENVTTDGKTRFLHAELGAKTTKIGELEQRIQSGGGGKGGPGSLINLKTMQPKVFSGASGDQFKTWAKKVRSYLNGYRTGFKKFLKWVEAQTTPIDPANMSCGWVHKDTISEELYDFLMQQTTGDAQVIIELVEDNGPEAWRQLCKRYDPIGEAYVLDQMSSLMEVPRCKTLIELPNAIAKWERLHNHYTERTGSSVPEDWKVPILFKMIPADKHDEYKMRHRAAPPQDKAYLPFSRLLIELAQEKRYDTMARKNPDDMELCLADRQEQNEKSSEKPTAYDQDYSNEDWDAYELDLNQKNEKIQEELNWLGSQRKGGGKGNGATKGG